MATVSIDGKDYEATPLTEPQLLDWSCFLSRLNQSSYWIFLHETIKMLPPRLQEVIVARSAPPIKLDRLRYWELAVKVESIEYLVNMTVSGPCPVVTHANAADIFLALAPLILDRPVVLEGGEALAKLREASDAE